MNVNWENYRRSDGTLDLVQALLDTTSSTDTARTRKAIEFLADLEDRFPVRTHAAAGTAHFHAQRLMRNGF